VTDREALILATSALSYAAGFIQGRDEKWHPYIEEQLKRIRKHLKESPCPGTTK